MWKRLWAWLTSRFATQQQRDPEADRLIFAFWDGRQTRRVDPWRTYRAILADEHFHYANHMPAVERGEEPETTWCMEALCRAFGVSRFDPATGVGLTDWELLNLLEDFTAYLDALEKKTGDGPTSSSPTAGTSSGSPAVQNSTTSSSSASGATSSEPSVVTPPA